MLMNRRTALAAMTASTFAAPVIAKTRSVDDHPLMLNAIAYIGTPDYTATEGVLRGPKWIETVLKMNRLLLIKHGDELFPDPSLYLRSPANTFERHIERSSYTFEFAFDGRPPIPDGYESYEDLIIDIMVDRVYEDYLVFLKGAPSRFGGPIRPYVPITTDRVVINARTFEPEIPFKTRFGVA
jgi:hypothetical protein